MSGFYSNRGRIKMKVYLYNPTDKNMQPIREITLLNTISFKTKKQTIKEQKEFFFQPLNIQDISIEEIKETEEPELNNGKRCFHKDLVQAIETGNLIDLISCNEKLEIIDGHHRYELAKRQNLKTIPVIIIKNTYIICESCQTEIKKFEDLRIDYGNYCKNCYNQGDK